MDANILAEDELATRLLRNNFYGRRAPVWFASWLKRREERNHLERENAMIEREQALARDRTSTLWSAPLKFCWAALKTSLRTSRIQRADVNPTKYRQGACSSSATLRKQSCGTGSTAGTRTMTQGSRPALLTSLLEQAGITSPPWLGHHYGRHCHVRRWCPLLACTSAPFAASSVASIGLAVPTPFYTSILLHIDFS